MTRPALTIVTLCLAASAAGGGTPTVIGDRVRPPETFEISDYPYDVSYGGHPPGGYERRIGRPYYWSIPGGTVPLNGPHGNEFGAGPGETPMGISSQFGPTAGPAGDPYTYHFGPGFYRSEEFGHYRFPYYSYRRPWYDVGHPVRVRDTNLPW